MLYVDRLADVMAPMSDGASITDLLAPAVIAGELSLFAECDEAELVRARQRNPALIDALRVVRVPEATPAQVDRAARAVRPARSIRRSSSSHDAARRLVELLAAFRRDTAFPARRSQFVDYCSLQKQQRRCRSPSSRRRSARGRACPSICSRPNARSTPRRSRPQLAEGRRSARTHACTVAARVIARLKAGLDDPQRPVGALLFAGPTGVGKTELAKQLARYLFGDADRLVRVDMSEITTPVGDRAPDHALARGHVARRSHPPPAALGRPVRRDREGRRRGVRSPARRARRRPPDRRTRPPDRLPHVADRDDDEPRRRRSAPRRLLVRPDAAPDPIGAIKNFFRPELLGRLDSVVAFRPLPPRALERIVDLELDKLRARPGIVARNLRLELTPAARARLAVLGHDPKLGARPLRRTIEDLVVAPLAERMAKEPSWRDATVRIATAESEKS